MKLAHGLMAAATVAILSVVMAACLPDPPEPEKDWSAHDSEISFIAFGPDGQTLLSLSTDGVLRRWTVPEFTARKLTGVPEQTDCAAVSPDSRLLAVATKKQVHLVDLTTDESVKELSCRTDVHRFLFSADGSHLSAVLADLSVTVFNTESWTVAAESRPLRVAVFGNRFANVDFQIKERQFVVASQTKRQALDVLDLNSGKRITTWNSPEVGMKNKGTVRLSPDGKTAWSLTWVGGLGCWDARTGEFQRFVKAHDHCRGTDDLAFTVDSRLVATVKPTDGTPLIRVWKTSDLSLVAEFFRANDVRSGNMPLGWTSVAFDPKGDRLAAGDGSGNLTVWRLGSEK